MRSVIHLKLGLMVLFLHAAIVLYFASILGDSYSPLRESWNLLRLFEFAVADNLNQMLFDNLIQGKRVFFSFPYLAADMLGVDALPFMRALLLLIAILSGFGLFLVFDRFFPNNPLFCATASLLMMYYPNDGTIFWLGAFGVHFGFLFGIYSLYFLLRSIEGRSIVSLAFCLILLLASARSYPGQLPLLAAVAGLFFLMKRNLWQIWWGKLVGFIIVFAIGFFPYVLRTFSGSGFEGKASDFSLVKTAEGFLNAAHYLFLKNFAEMFNIKYVQAGDFLAIVGLVCLLFYFMFKYSSSQCVYEEHESRQQYYQHLIPVLLLVALLIMFVGYGPYAVTIERFQIHRQLLFARFGVILLFTVILFLIVERLARNRKYHLILRILLPAIVVAFSVQAKVDVAKQYALGSELQRVMLGDLALAMPAFKDETAILLILKDKKVVSRATSIYFYKAKAPLGYLYEKKLTNVASTNAFVPNKFGSIRFDGETLFVPMGRKKTIQMDVNNLVVLSYTLEGGYEVLDRLELPGSKGGEDIVIEHISSDQRIEKSVDLTERQQWFVSERNRLVDSVRTRMSAKPRQTFRGLY